MLKLHARSRSRILLTGATSAALVAMIGVGIAQSSGGLGNSGDTSEVDVTEQTSSITTPCDRFVNQLKSGSPVAESASDVGLPDSVSVPRLTSISSYICTSVRDELGNGDVLGLLLIGETEAGQGGVYILSEAAFADSTFDQSAQISTLTDHGLGPVQAFDHGFLGGNLVDSPDAVGQDAWTLLEAHLGASR